MKRNNHFGSRRLMVGTTLLVAFGTLVASAQFGRSTRARIANDIANARQVKLALDAFATDFDGQYPNDDTSEMIVEGGAGDQSANDYFRQLFLAGSTDSELIFWVNKARVCNKRRPDDEIRVAGRMKRDEILKAGDNGPAYMREQTNLSPVARPLIVSAYTPGTTDFDKKLYRGDAILVRIDGAAFAVELDAKGRLVRNGIDYLDPKAKHWQDSKIEPAKLLIQPLPSAEAVPADKQKAEEKPAPKPE